MTGAGKVRRHKKWLRDREIDGEFTGRELVALMNLFKDERNGLGLDRPRLREHELTYARLMKFMGVILAGTAGARRCEAYKMVLRRAWQREELVCFDIELINELHSICRWLSNVRWRDAAKVRNFDVKFDRILTPRFSRDVAELNTYGQDIRKALAFQAAHDIAISVVHSPNGGVGFSMGCRVAK